MAFSMSATRVRGLRRRFLYHIVHFSTDRNRHHRFITGPAAHPNAVSVPFASITLSSDGRSVPYPRIANPVDLPGFAPVRIPVHPPAPSIRGLPCFDREGWWRWREWFRVLSGGSPRAGVIRVSLVVRPPTGGSPAWRLLLLSPVRIQIGLLCCEHQKENRKIGICMRLLVHL